MHKLLATLVMLIAFTTAPLQAAPVYETDPAHFTLEFENDAAKIIRANWGPKEVFAGTLELGDLAVVRLAPANFRVTLPDGKKVDRASNLGAA